MTITGQVDEREQCSSAPRSGRSDQPERGPSLRADLRRARAAVLQAELTLRPSDRFLAAHVAALRVAALVLALRARPGLTPTRPRNAWHVLAEVAPELAEWAAFFAATHGKREAIRAGATAIVSARQADDLVRDAQAFLALVERSAERWVGAFGERPVGTLAERAVGTLAERPVEPCARRSGDPERSGPGGASETGPRLEAAAVMR